MAEGCSTRLRLQPPNEVYVNCLIDTKSGTWMPPDTAEHFDKKRRAAIKHYKCIFRKFKRCPIECHKCQQTINKNDLVAGLPLKDVRGPFGYITLWHHVTCATPIIDRLLGLKRAIAAPPNGLENRLDEARRPGEGLVEKGPTAEEATSQTTGADIPNSSMPTGKLKKGEKKKKKTGGPTDEPAATATAVTVEDGVTQADDQPESPKTKREDPLSQLLSQESFGFDDLGMAKSQAVRMIRDSLEMQGMDDDLPEIRDAVETAPVEAKPEVLPQPPELLVPLLPFQRDGLTWMYHQEKGNIKGGILADEMGMGKTIQTIALLVTSKRESLANRTNDNATLSQVKSEVEATHNSLGDDASTQDGMGSQGDGVTYKPAMQPGKTKKHKKNTKNVAEKTSMLNRRGGTLIVCPLAALLQWYNEIMSKVKDGCLSVLIYHGPLRKNIAHALHEYDVVLTTYAIVEAEFRKVQNQKKLICQYCGRIFMQKTLVLHQKYFCGPFARRTEKQRLSERKRESSSVVLKIHARLFPDIKQALDEINAANDTDENETGYNKRRKLEEEQDEVETALDIAEFYGKKLLKIEIIDAFTIFGFPEDEVELAVELLKQGVEPFMARMKEVAVKVGLPEMENFEMLQNFAAAGNLGVEEFKRTTVVDLRGLVGCLGLGAFGCKAELINKVIVFINKMRQMGQHVSEILSQAMATADVAQNASRLHAGDSIVKHEGGMAAGDICVKEEEAGDYSHTSNGRTAPSGSDVKEETESRGHGVHYKPMKSEVKKENSDSHKVELTEPAIEERIYQGSVLHEIIWERIVIDEAHRIKTKSNSTSQAIIGLRSYAARWCLTGTPLQNRVGDVFSLISFLKVYPYAYNFCSKDGCTCHSTELACEDYRYCDLCGHSRINHYSFFNKRILKPILNNGYQNEGEVAMRTLHNDVFSRIMLRRTKQEKAKDVNLPPMHVTIRRDTLSDFERDFYEALYKQSTIKFDTYAKAGTLLHNYAHIFDLLIRLRQAVDHPYLILYGPSSLAMKAVSALDPGKKAQLEAAVKESLPASGTERSCGLCFDTLTDEHDFVTAHCGHSFHQMCLNDYLQSRPADALGDDNNAVTCPTCYVPLTIKMKNTPQVSAENLAKEMETPAKLKQSILNHIKPSEFKSSTKIEALFSEISQCLTTTTDKCLVFSQYCAMLDLIAFRLKTAQIQCAVLVGSTSLAARRNMLLEFNNNPALRVLLISLKAGGEGLNLQIANRIFLMDPWWNPASELQAIQRAHRIGQTKPVYAIRFICKDTIEERIIELQEKKMIVFDATICSSAASMAKLSSEDLSFLFKR